MEDNKLTGGLYLAIIIAILGPNVICGARCNKDIRWISPLSDSDVIKMRPEAAGLAGNVHLYVCRGAVNATYIKPGSLWADKGSIYCSVSEADSEIKFTTYQILEAPPGTTSWVPATPNLPEHAIVAGNLWDGSPTYVCRGWTTKWFLVGHYNSQNHICFAAQDNQPIEIRNNVEILVVSGYGDAL